MRSANGRRRRRADADSARVFRPRGRPARVHAAGAGRVRGRAGFFAARSRAAQGGRGDSRARGARGGTAAARMAHGADYRERLRRHRAARTARGAPDVYRTRRWNHGCRGAGAQALRDSQNHHSCGRLARARRRRALLLLQSLGRDDRVQGPAHLEPDSAVLSRPQRPGDQDRACDGASAVFDQHLPELGPRASVPLSLPQRRDQHAAREYQLDGRAAGTVRLAAIRRRHAKAAADNRADRQRLLHVRQLPGAAGAYRALAAARGDDDDPGGVAERRDDERGQARVLRIPLQPDGAVGRAGLDRVHRRPAYRRRARSQRTAPLALPGDQGRDGRDGFRSRCARYSARAGRAQGPPAAGPHVLYRHGRGPHRRGRGNQGLDGRAQAVPAVARREPGRSRPVSLRRPTRRPSPPSRPTTCPSNSRPSAIRPKS